jgi:hypothetical protein
VQLENFGMSSSWDLSRTVLLHAHHTETAASGSARIRSRFSIIMLVQRKPGYYLWNIELPMGVLTTLATVTFALPGELANQISISLTLVLTAVAYKLTVASHVPVVSYTTQLDIFVSMCFLFMVLATVQAVLVPSLAPNDEAAQTHLTLKLGIGWTVLWLLGLVWYGWLVAQTHRLRRRFKTRFDGESRVDQLGRMLSRWTSHARPAGKNVQQHGGFQRLEA